MADLAYYGKEHERRHEMFPELVAAPCTFADACILIRRLAEENGVRIYRIERTSGRRNSVWYETERRIVLNAGANDAVSWGTAIHEFAHALDHKIRPKSSRRHDTAFMDLVLDLCRIVRDRQWHISIPAERKVAESEAAKRDADRAERRRVREAIESNPHNVRTKKIERRRAQIARMERKIKALSTRLKSAKRSLAALERAAQKGGTDD